MQQCTYKEKLITIDPLRNRGQKMNSSRHVAIVTEFSLKNANGPNNHK